MSLQSIALLILLSAVLECSAAELAAWKEHNHGWDLLSYISRPDIRAPKIRIDRYDPNAVTPGYWFTSPYGSLSTNTRGCGYRPYQAGPVIYDHRGELVWSGAKIFSNRNVFDFKVSTINDTAFLTFMLQETTDKHATFYPQSTALLLNSSYEVVDAIDLSKGFNMHELNIVDAKTVLHVVTDDKSVNLAEIGLQGKRGVVSNTGFREVDLAGKVSFEWHPHPRIALTEVMTLKPDDPTRGSWDAYHLNSVDKNEDGDYLVSIKHTNALYKLSGKDGSIIWRLGGTRSDFDQNFNFSSQHHARFHEHNSSVTIVSFFDNAADEQGLQKDTANVSAMKVVALYEDTQPMKARVIKQYNRPDGQLTRFRGQAQVLPNGGAFVGWSEGSYMTEFAPDGRCVLEARFASNRYASYRSYVSDFVGMPTEPIALKTLAYGSGFTSETMSSVFYVSWNGATEVASYSFYGTNDLAAEFQRLGSLPKTGFETTFLARNFWKHSYVEAMDKDGNVLGKSEVGEIIMPNRLDGQDVNYNQTPTGATGATSDIQISDQMVTLRLNKVTAIILAIITIFLATCGLVSTGFFVWKTFSSSSRPWYSSLGHKEEDSGEEGEMAALNLHGESDDEDNSDDEGGYTRNDHEKARNGR